MFLSKKKSNVEILIDAYRVGGIPLVLIMLGASLLFREIVVGIDDQNSTLQWISLIIVFGGIFLQGVYIYTNSKLKAIILSIAIESIKVAGTVSTDGGQFQLATRDIPDVLNKIIGTLISSENNDNK